MNPRMTMVKILLGCITLTLTSPVLPQTPIQLEGVLCVARDFAETTDSPLCVDTVGEAFRVVPESYDRLFVWRSKDGNLVHLGYIPAGKEELQLDADSPNVTLSVVSSDETIASLSTRWRLLQNTGTGGWAWALSEKQLTKNRKNLAVHYPPGSYELTVAADHHAPFHERIDTRRNRNQELGEVRLHRLPQIQGRVLERHSEIPLADVQVQSLSEEVIATSAPDGSYAIEIADSWPKAFRFTLPGYGTEVVPLPQAEGDLVLPPVTLTPASQIILAVSGLQREATGFLFLKSAGGGKPLEVAIMHGSEEFHFKDLAAGEYMILIRGDDPLEQYALSIELDEGTTVEEVIEIEQSRVDFEVSADRTPQPNVTIEAVNAHHQWHGSLLTDHEGKAVSRLWQTGEFGAAVSTPSGQTLFVNQRLDGGEIDWKIELPSRRIEGLIHDKQSRRPVANATVYLETETAESTSIVRTESDAEGRFTFEFVRHGFQTVRVNAERYLTFKTSFILFESEPDYRLRIDLESGTTRHLRVTNPAGIPIPGAVVVAASGDSFSTLETDSQGMVEVASPTAELTTFYVIPREGSFARVRMSSADRTDDRVIQVRVPVGDNSLFIRTFKSSGTPLADVNLLARYEGEFLPLPVMSLMQQLQGNVWRTGRDGGTSLIRMPAGRYEFWPYFASREIALITQGLHGESQASVLANTGSHTVTMTFSRSGR
jgi:hypothetical protein